MQKVNFALIGCGGFAREIHVPNILAHDRMHLHAAVDLSLSAARSLAERGGASYWTDEVGRVLSDPQVDAVLIATPHHTHAAHTIQAARAGKHVFCEKPMGLNEPECLAVAEAVQEMGIKYTAGYNRCVAPFTRQARELLVGLGAPILVNHRIADWNPYSRGWLLDEKLSGGRLVGEAGHALDMICQLVDQHPNRVYAEGGKFVQETSGDTPDSAIVTLGFPNGSVGVLFLSSAANNGFPKEEIQINCANHTVVIYAFERMEIFSPQGHRSFVLPQMDKGQKVLLQEFARAIIENIPSPAGLDVALRASRCTFAALESVRSHQVQSLSPPDSHLAAGSRS